MIVLTPTFLLDADPLSQPSPPVKSDHSIEDIIALFPSPPMHVSVERAPCPNELDLEPNLRLSTKEHRSSLSTSGSLLSVTSVGTAATSPPTTPELDQMMRMMSVSNSVGIVVEHFKSHCCRPSLIGSPLESVEFAGAVPLQPRKQTLDQVSECPPSCCTQAAPTSVSLSYLSLWDNGHKNLDSVTPSDLLLRDGDIVSADASEDLETSLTAITQADSEPMRTGTSFRSMKHVLHAFRDSDGEDRLREESCFPGESRFTVLQCLNASTPSSSTDRFQVAPSSSEGLATSNFIGGNSHMNRSPAPFLYTHGSSSHLGPNIDTQGPRRIKIMAIPSNHSMPRLAIPETTPPY